MMTAPHPCLVPPHALAMQIQTVCECCCCCCITCRLIPTSSQRGRLKDDNAMTCPCPLPLPRPHPPHLFLHTRWRQHLLLTLSPSHPHPLCLSPHTRWRCLALISPSSRPHPPHPSLHMWWWWHLALPLSSPPCPSLHIDTRRWRQLMRTVSAIASSTSPPYQE